MYDIISNTVCQIQKLSGDKCISPWIQFEVCANNPPLQLSHKIYYPHKPSLTREYGTHRMHYCLDFQKCKHLTWGRSCQLPYWRSIITTQLSREQQLSSAMISRYRKAVLHSGIRILPGSLTCRTLEPLLIKGIHWETQLQVLIALGQDRVWKFIWCRSRLSNLREGANAHDAGPDSRAPTPNVPERMGYLSKFACELGPHRA